MSSFNIPSMLTPHDDTVIAWQQACTQAADALRSQHDRERLAKALALAHEGAITLDDDGALVTSHGAHYRIDADGLCQCPDMQNRGVACKHVLALQIHRQATATLTTSTPDATPLATATVTATPESTATVTPEATATPTATETPAATATATATASVDPTPTVTASVDPTPTVTATPTTYTKRQYPLEQGRDADNRHS